MGKTVYGLTPQCVMVRVQLCYKVGKNRRVYIRTLETRDFVDEPSGWKAFRTLKKALKRHS